MKKKTVYKLMGAIIGVSLILFAVIYFLDLQNKAKDFASTVTGGAPTFREFLQGDFSNPLDKPMDVSNIGSLVYVTDTNNKRVQVFDESGTPVFKFGKEGKDKGQFKFPYGIAGDDKGNVYVADLYNGKISIFTSKGKFIKYFEEKNKKLIKTPAGLRIFNNKIYVTDIQQGKVLVYKLDGEKVLEISTGINKDDKLNAPNAVTVDSDNNIYVSDSGNQRVLKYNKSGRYTMTFNGTENGKGESIFVNPRGLAVDSNGTLFIIDNMSHFVYGFDDKGKKLYQFGGMGDGNEQFYLPNGLNMDENGRLYITDTFNQRVAVYN